MSGTGYYKRSTGNRQEIATRDSDERHNDEIRQRWAGAKGGRADAATPEIDSLTLIGNRDRMPEYRTILRTGRTRSKKSGDGGNKAA
jgi:hypothetical protein